MSACVPYVVTYTETVIKEKVVCAVTSEDAKEQVESDCEVGFGEVLRVELQQ
jgi:hypothetical protein